jgi:ubiquinone/menaquinone biosynthesis C-methylase UbiE
MALVATQFDIDMNGSPNAIILQENERIVREYVRRDGEMPKDYYSLLYPANLFMHASRNHVFFKLLKSQRRVDLTTQYVLEVGCGTGGWLIDFERWGTLPQQLAGIDLDHRYLDTARARLPGADLRIGDASNLPWPDRTFDVVIQSTVFSSILVPTLQQRIANEMVRVCKPNGFILWFDFRYNNPWNSQVRGIKRPEIKRLFPQAQIHLRSLILVPPLLRKLARRWWVSCWMLEKIPLLRTHYLGLIFHLAKRKEALYHER